MHDELTKMLLIHTSFICCFILFIFHLFNTNNDVFICAAIDKELHGVIRCLINSGLVVIDGIHCLLVWN